MAGDNDEPDNAAARLEAALERIAVAAERLSTAPEPVAPTWREATPVAPAPAQPAASVDPAIVARLDGLIERLRGVLAVRAG
jgi:hypothetical protein